MCSNVTCLARLQGLLRPWPRFSAANELYHLWTAFGKPCNPISFTIMSPSFIRGRQCCQPWTAVGGCAPTDHGPSRFVSKNSIHRPTRKTFFSNDLYWAIASRADNGIYRAIVIPSTIRVLLSSQCHTIHRLPHIHFSLYSSWCI